jgi:hypothetical protein
MFLDDPSIVYTMYSMMNVTIYGRIVGGDGDGTDYLICELMI